MRPLLILLMLTTSAFAQQQPYIAPDAEIWMWMVKALREIPASADAHDAVARILAQVQQEARLREMRAKAQQSKTEEK